MRQWIIAAAVTMGLVACGPTDNGAGSDPSQSNTASAPAAPSSGSGSGGATLPGGQKLSGTPIQLADITWGGDYPTIWCNGGDQTREGTICDEFGLNLKVVLGDNTDEQLADYKARRTPFLRGTYTMIGVHAGELCQVDPGLCPMYAFQMTYSQGDWLVARDGIDTLKDLRGKTVAIQKGGPHLGFLYEILADDGLSWSDVNVKWMDNLDGKDSPADIFASNPDIDAAFVITPDMFGLTGGPDSVGTGAEGSVKGAKVLVSTADRRRTIADVYFVSTEWAQAHPDELRNFAMAYLKSAETVKDLQTEFDRGGSPQYEALVNAAFKRYPVFNGLAWEDADGLYRDATFVGHAGNVAFLNPDPGVPGFSEFTDRTREVADALGLPSDFQIKAAPIDWNHAVFNGLATKGMQRQSAFQVEALRGEIEEMAAAGTLGDSASIRFSAHFAADETVFDSSKFSDDFDRLIDLAGKYSTAPVVLSCHVDTAAIIDATFRAAAQSGKLKRTGSSGNYSYTFNGQPLDISNIEQVMRLIRDPQFNQQIPKNQQPLAMMEQAQTLSLQRCETGRTALLEYAQSHGKRLDPNQIQAVGMGIRDPAVVVPRSPDESRQNRRIEFSLTRVTLESTASYDW